MTEQPEYDYCDLHDLMHRADVPCSVCNQIDKLKSENAALKLQTQDLCLERDEYKSERNRAIHDLDKAREERDKIHAALCLSEQRAQGLRGGLEKIHFMREDNCFVPDNALRMANIAHETLEKFK